ncbi:MAG TPA: hypothetical protein VM286_00335 [Candidatus Thermoplasmatota archaeon]|nr:hypothetical protein [Candidatus Thermoplasmatota archaeon]
MGDNGDSKALVYIAIGAVAAVGAGYLVWRYGMTPAQRQKAIQMMREASGKAKEAIAAATASAKDTMGDLRGSMVEMTEQARDGATQVRATAVRKASEASARLRP